MLEDSARRAVLAAEGAALVRDRVRQRSGARGLALHAALRLLDSARPGALPRIIERLLPEFLDALEPLHDAAAQAGDSSGFMLRDPAATATALLAVADRRVSDSGRQALQAVYRRIRGGAQRELLDAMPVLSLTLDRVLADGR